MTIVSIKSLFAKSITSVEQGVYFLNALINAGMLLHLEDDPATLIFTEITPAEAELIKQRVNELYSFSWSAYEAECPIGYCLQVMKALILLPTYRSQVNVIISHNKG